MTAAATSAARVCQHILLLCLHAWQRGCINNLTSQQTIAAASAAGACSSLSLTYVGALL